MAGRRAEEELRHMLGQLMRCLKYPQTHAYLFRRTYRTGNDAGRCSSCAEELGK